MSIAYPTFRSRIHSFPAKFKSPSVLPLSLNLTSRPFSIARVRVSDSQQLKVDWLDSISCPFGETSSQPNTTVGFDDPTTADLGSQWIVGIDPDTSGALALLKPHTSDCLAPDTSGDLALLKPHTSDCLAQVFDTPYLRVLVGKKVRKRLDARSIVQLLRSFNAPLGTPAYIEQSIPFPQDGKQGWWCGGFTYGLWIGVLVASGFSVVPVPSRVWKDQFELFGSSATKDDSRRAASVLFPSLSSSLKRKKDHGRAEALLIAAYGKGLGIRTSVPVSV